MYVKEMAIDCFGEQSAFNSDCSQRLLHRKVYMVSHEEEENKHMLDSTSVCINYFTTPCRKVLHELAQGVIQVTSRGS